MVKVPTVVLGRDRARAVRPLHQQLPTKGGDQGRQLGGRICVGQAATHRAAVADRDVTHVAQGLRQQRHGRRGDLARQLDVALSGHRPDQQAAVVHLDAVEPGDPVDVDQNRRPGQPEVHQRDEALPAREHLRVGAVLSEQRHRLPDVAGSGVSDGRWLHCDPSSVRAWAARIRSSRRGGVTGNRVTVTPRSLSASSIALPTRETPAIVPASPTPLIPPGMSGAGVSWW